MSLTLKGIMFAAVLILGFGGFIVTEVRAQPATEILRRLDKRNSELKTLKSGVTWVKENKQIQESDTQVGRIKYIKKTPKNVMYVRLDWDSPAESMSVIGNDYLIYRKDLGTVYIGKTTDAKSKAKAGNAFSFITMSRKELNDNFTYKLLGVETIPGGISTFNLELTPKGKTTYKLVHLFVDPNGMPRMIRIFERDGYTVSTVLLTNPEDNATLNGSDFKINPPPSIKPIR